MSPEKNCAKLFLSEPRQISSDFDNFWQKDSKEAKIMRSAFIFRTSVIYFSMLYADHMKQLITV